LPEQIDRKKVRHGVRAGSKVPNMPRIALASATALCLLAAPAAAEAAPARAISAYAYYAKSDPGDPFARGLIWTALRTNRALREDRFGNPVVKGGGLYVISRSQHCYGSYAEVPKGKAIPKSVRVKLGKAGSLIDTRLRVLPVRPGYGQGGAIGCTRDHKAAIFTSNLSRTPLVEPANLFFAANNGPRVVDIRWHRWGTHRAVGYGAYMARFAGSEGSEEELDVRPARVILSDPKMCASYGALSYSKFTLITWDGRYRKHVQRSGGTCS
jgi:hypothetical protein